MAKMRIGDLEVEAKTPAQAMKMMDKLVQYAKILQVPAEALSTCPVCGSYDIHPVSPTVNECHNCGAEIEFINDIPEG
jgi:ribosomal protein L32